MSNPYSMRLWAISDLHLDFRENRAFVRGIAAHPEDWLVLAGDISHRLDDLRWVLDLLVPRFRRLVWVPGNHDLWTDGDGEQQLTGEAKYQAMVQICQRRQVLTPEDPFSDLWVHGRAYTLCPLFVGYDYSFRPADVSRQGALAWAKEERIMCADEFYLRSAPHPTMDAWCAARCEATEARLDAVDPQHSTILVSHFPLREDLIRIRIPRFSLWCGTRRTESWHLRYNAAVAISGHLHVPSMRYRDQTRFEEVSLGYPKQWKWRAKPPALREIQL